MGLFKELLLVPVSILQRLLPAYLLCICSCKNTTETSLGPLAFPGTPRLGFVLFGGFFVVVKDGFPKGQITAVHS